MLKAHAIVCMTTVAQKLFNLTTVPVASLEWGSHRKELGLARHIPSEHEVAVAKKVITTHPVTKRKTRHYFPKPVVDGLENVVFHPGLGIIRASGYPIAESLPIYYKGPLLKPLNRFRFHDTPSIVATAFTIQTNYYHFLVEDLPRLRLLKEGIKSQ